jgi:SMI1-KNR4 cell-wall
LEAPDAPSSEGQIEAIERDLKFKLPDSYRGFLKEFGGGAFGLTNVFNANSDAYYYIVEQNISAKLILPNDYIAISDDHCGGWYVLQVADGVAGETIYYWNNDGGLKATGYANVLELVAKNAYDAA